MPRAATSLCVPSEGGLFGNKHFHVWLMALISNESVIFPPVGFWRLPLIAALGRVSGDAALQWFTVTALPFRIDEHLESVTGLTVVPNSTEQKSDSCCKITVNPTVFWSSLSFAQNGRRI